MKFSTVETLRASLLVASLAAIAIDSVVLVALGLFGVPERVVETAPFRLGVVIVIALVLVVTRRVARSAFRSAVASRHAVVCGTRRPTVSVAHDCPLRLLVVYHLRLNRARLAWTGQ